MNINTFDLMIEHAANKFFRRSKVANNAFATFDLLIIIVTNKFLVANNAFDLMNFNRFLKNY